MKSSKYQTIFSSIIKPVVSADKDKYLSLASLEQLRAFIPDIDTVKNYDLLPISFNVCVVNRINKNGDAIDTDTGLAVYKQFINKFIDIEHKRSNVIGVIISSTLSEFGTDKPLTEEDVKGTLKPFNITLGGIIWRVINNRLADAIEESNDPTSEYYMSISSSWELGFDNFNLILIKGDSKNLEDAKIIDNQEEVEKLKVNLRAFGGSGKIGEFNVYRESGDGTLPMGVGLTENPAAEVKGVATEATEELNANSEIKIDEILECEKNDKESSQATKTDVTTIDKIMKITKLQDITDESLKTITASAMHDFINEEIKKANDLYVAEKSAKETLEAKKNDLITEVENIKKTLNTLEAEKQEKDALEKLSQRMASFDEEFNLDAEDRQVIVTQIKDLSDEAFAAYKKSAAVLMKEKKKVSKKEQQDQKEDSQDDKSGKPAKDSKKEKQDQLEDSKDKSSKASAAVDDAIDKSKIDKNVVPNSSEAKEITLKEKFAKHFALDQFIIKK